LQRQVDDLPADVVRNAIPDAIRSRAMVGQRLRPSSPIAVVPTIECGAWDSELVQRALGRQMRLLHQLDDLGLLGCMCASDVTATLDQALAASGLDGVTVVHRPRLLSDNGASYVAGDLANWLENKGMKHVRGAPYHPQTQGKIERWHQTLKNRILLENYYLPGDLDRQIGAFVEHYNHVRYHESIQNVTPADVYFGRAQMVLAERRRIKLATIANRRLQHRLQAA
jgi:transposase InsO family protein